MNLFIKLGYILVGTLFLTQIASAQGHSQDGLYMGVDATYDISRFSDFAVESLTDTLPTDVKTIYNDEGPAAGIFIGFRFTQGRYTVATEARYGYSFIENDLSLTDSFKLTNEFGGSILPGYWLSDQIVVFGRIGFSQLTAIRTFDGILNKNSDTGLHFGGGIQLFATDTISFRAEYNRATFNHNMSQVIEDTTTIPSTFEQVDFINNFKRDRFQVSLISRF